MASGLEVDSTAAGQPLSGGGSRLRTPAKRWNRLVGESPAALRLEQMISRAAGVDSTVLIAGETGCGKEEIARAIHALGPRSDRPFVAVNCGAMAATLIESQLFGHEKGSFTGAIGASHGVFRAAQGGVVFLDEIGEMPLDLQPRLLRVLQEREVTPIGSTQSHTVDVQVIAATNRDLLDQVAKAAFREDLYYRLNTIEIDVPPLRDRTEDIPLFVAHFCRHFAARFGTEEWLPDASTLERFARYRWPGNVRQLAQAIERVYALGDLPDLTDLPDDRRPKPTTGAEGSLASRMLPEDFGDEAPLPVLNLEALRRIAVRQAMALTNGHKGQAAGLLGVHINTMTKLVEETLPALSQRRRPRVK